MAEKKKEALALANGQAPEAALKEAALYLGRAQVFQANQALNSAGLAMTLTYFKQNPDALKLIGFENLTDLCRSFGMKLQTASELIKHLETFGEDFMAAADDLQLTRRHMRAGRALPDGQKPEVQGRLLILSGTAFDLEKPRDREKVRDEFEALARAREREAKKAEREKAEITEHGERQIRTLRGKLDRMGAELRDLGLTVDGKGHPAVDLLKMARENALTAINQLRAALAETKKAKPEFRAQVYAEVMGAAEALSKMADALVKETADALDD